MKMNRRKLRNLLLTETKQILKEGDPEYMAAQGALSALQNLLDPSGDDARISVIAIIDSCVKSGLISSQQAENLKRDHDLLV